MALNAIEDRARSTDAGNLGCWLGMRMQELNRTQGKSLDPSTRNTIETIITLTWTLRYEDTHRIYPIHLLALGLKASWERFVFLRDNNSSNSHRDMFISHMSRSVDLAVEILAAHDHSLMVAVVPPLLLACQSYGELLVATNHPSKALTMVQKLRPFAEAVGLRMGVKRGITAQFLRHASTWATKTISLFGSEMMDPGVRDEAVGMAVMAVDMIEEEQREGNNPSITDKVGCMVRWPSKHGIMCTYSDIRARM